MLIQLQQVSVAFGAAPVLDRVDLQIERGERVCLLGRNGSGKSTLLKVLHGDLRPDGGAVHLVNDSRIAALPQEVPAGLSGTARCSRATTP